MSQLCRPLLKKHRSEAGQGWPAELFRYACQEDGKVSKCHVLFPCSNPVCCSSAWHLPDEVKPSVLTPVSRTISLSADDMLPLVAACFNCSMVSWVTGSLLQGSCQAGACLCTSTKHRLFASCHLIECLRFQKHSLLMATMPCIWQHTDRPMTRCTTLATVLRASLQRKGLHGMRMFWNMYACSKICSHCMIEKEQAQKPAAGQQLPLAGTR